MKISDINSGWAQSLMNDGSFQNKFKADPVLLRLLHEPKTAAAVSNYELTLVNSYEVYIGKYAFPPLTIGGLSLLDLLDSPLIAQVEKDAEPPPMTGLDICKALYILAKREDAAAQIGRIAGLRFEQECLRDQEIDTPDSYIAAKREEINNQIKIREEEFENSVLTLILDYRDIDLDAVFSLFNELLLQPGGFGMIPDTARKLPTKVPRRFGSDWLTGLVSQVSEMTNDSSFYIKWRMSLAEVSYYVVQGLRKAGVRGIQARTRSGDAMKRTKELMIEHIEERRKRRAAR